ncbi:MAG: glucose 1-dehydrogenase [Dehalococcoidia bacterium]|nr:glucose 1-dehydrogenase [Dehalococcoidia bacterium]
MGRLEGKVALITGGARGQGAAEARMFIAEGAQVIITDVQDELGEETAAATGARYLHHDVSIEADWARVVAAVVAEHGRLDVLVNNAGVYEHLRMLDTPLAVYERIVAVNQVGVFLGMKAAAGVMADRGGGSIVNIASNAALSGHPGHFAYVASKWAVRGMSKAAARELGRYNIRVNCVFPGATETPLLHKNPIVDVDGGAVMLRGQPIRRIARPDEVGHVVLFLASDESSYATGGEFTVDGGASI